MHAVCVEHTPHIATEHHHARRRELGFGEPVRCTPCPYNPHRRPLRNRRTTDERLRREQGAATPRLNGHCSVGWRVDARTITRTHRRYRTQKPRVRRGDLLTHSYTNTHTHTRTHAHAQPPKEGTKPNRHLVDTTYMATTALAEIRERGRKLHRQAASNCVITSHQACVVTLTQPRLVRPPWMSFTSCRMRRAWPMRQ